MIPLQFGLWWSGSKLSYLRYLTFKTLRHFHPDSKIQLFLGKKFKKNGHIWDVEKQDFENSNTIKKDYMDKLIDINVEIIEVDWFFQYEPNYQSDIFRYWYLKNISGFYLDTDQIILRSFKDLPLNNDFIYSEYPIESLKGLYTPVGVLGSIKESEIINFIYNNITKFVDNKNYNSAGPFMFLKVLKSKKWEDKMFNAPSHYFYPVSDSCLVETIYDGKLKEPRNSFSLHWYGGHPKSQEFNKKYDEFFAKNSTDTISCLIREMELL